MAEGIQLTSPVSEPTRKGRRSMLLMSVVLLAITYGGIQPGKIEQLGIEFSTEQQNAVVVVLLAIQLYLIAAFWVARPIDRYVWDRQFSAIAQAALSALSGEQRKLYRTPEHDGLGLLRTAERIWELSGDLHGYTGTTYYVNQILDHLRGIRVAVDETTGSRIGIGQRWANTVVSLSKSPGVPGHLYAAANVSVAVRDLIVDLTLLRDRYNPTTSFGPEVRKAIARCLPPLERVPVMLAGSAEAAAAVREIRELFQGEPIASIGFEPELLGRISRSIDTFTEHYRDHDVGFPTSEKEIEEFFALRSVTWHDVLRGPRFHALKIHDIVNDIVGATYKGFRRFRRQAAIELDVPLWISLAAAIATIGWVAEPWWTGTIMPIWRATVGDLNDARPHLATWSFANAALGRARGSR